MEVRKQITFDLDTKALQEYYPKENWRDAYKVIKKYMRDNGFEWQQGSVYVSKNEISTRKVSQILRKMAQHNSWLHKCMRDCKVSNVSREYSQNHLFNKKTQIPKRQEIQIQRMKI